MKTLDIRILLPSDKDAVATLGKRLSADPALSTMELELQSWHARWRAESLDHYLPMGWSFGAFQGTELLGFLIGQPLLFFRGLTQTLWLEHLCASDQSVAKHLLECAVRWARDKHFQCVLGENTDLLDGYAGGRSSGEPLIEIKTARY